MNLGGILPRNASSRLRSQSPARTLSDGATLARRLAARALPASPVGKFGLREAFYFGGHLDQWERYSAVLGAIERECDTTERLRILDAGAGGPGILAWTGTAPWLRHCQVTLLDVNRAALAGVHIRSVLASGGAMPFRDDAFDVAVSIDSIEHVPLAVQERYASELRRVAALVVVHCPAETPGGDYAGRRADARFQRWHVRRFGREEPNTAEHLATEQHPDPFALFPGARVTGSQPAHAWLRMVRDDHSPWRRHVSGFRYLRSAEASAPDGPFHAALVVWRR